MTYRKQDVNEFIAFKALFNQSLQTAIYKKDVEAIKNMLQNEYKEETEGNFYLHTEIDIDVIKNAYTTHIEEINNNPYLIYKL